MLYIILFISYYCSSVDEHNFSINQSSSVNYKIKHEIYLFNEIASSICFMLCLIGCATQKTNDVDKNRIVLITHFTRHFKKKTIMS